MTRLLVTGAAGIVGTFLHQRLPELGYSLRLLDAKPVEGAGEAEVLVGDIRDAALLDKAVDGVDAVIHLAGFSLENTFANILSVNMDGTYQVFEAARRAGVRRIVNASSNHAVGFTPRAEQVGIDVPLRPDTYYGLSKAFSEVLSRLYVDKYGMQIACLRIGSCFERPRNVRMLSTWLSPADMVRLVDACVQTPELGYACVYGISRNTRGWWDLEPGRAIGFEPQDDAEVYAAELIEKFGEIPLDSPDHVWLGGSFVTHEP